MRLARSSLNRSPLRSKQGGFIMVGRGRMMLGKPFNPLDLFRSGEQGVLYDPSDFSSMYQESTGITPVTALEQPVGLILDKRYSLARGSELWADASVTLTGESTKVSAGVYRVYSSAGAASSVNVPTTLVSGKWYEVTFNVDSIATAGTGIKLASTANTPTWTTTGAKRAIILANATSASITINSGVATDFQISGVSFKLLNGNHASQSTASSRPVVSARFNILNATAALSTQSVTTLAASYKLSFTGTGTVTLSGTSVAGPLVGTGANDRVSLTFTPTAGTLTLTVSGSVTLADLRLTADTLLNIPAYQSVTNSTTYDSAGFPVYLKTDGFDDGMVTNSIDFTGTDKMTVFAALTKLSDSATGVVFEHGPNVASTNGTFAVLATSNAGLARFGFGTRGTSAQGFIGNGSPYLYAAPISAVLSCAMDNGQPTSLLAIVPRVNGGPINNPVTDGVGPTAAGNYTAQTLYLFRRGGAAAPFNGRTFGLIVRGAASNQSQITKAERWLARKAALSF